MFIHRYFSSYGRSSYNIKAKAVVKYGDEKCARVKEEEKNSAN
jgi:hypothetical protein